jgi:hypothetical protein
METTVNRTITAAITVLMLSNLTAAFAESNNLSAVEHPATGVILSPPAGVATGSKAYPNFGGTQGVPVTSGGLVPTSGDQALQTANSAPPGFFGGTVDANYAQSVQRSFAAQAAQAARAARARIAAGTHSQHPG